ncbi:MAG: hypothetical protein JWL84_317 [Rhodospirillales bacterium]|nr:hypothetical protein [Rhodospirillales bacterium]
MQVPFSGVPTVAPDVAQPNGPQQINATPADFGSQIGAAANSAGAGLQQDSDTLMQTALKRAQLTNELMANDASTEYMKTASAKFGQFSQLQGKNAQAALPAFQQDLQDTWQATIKTMPNPAAAEMLDRGSRFFLDRFYQQAQTHADTQLTQWSQKSSLDRADELTNQAAIQVNTPQVMDRLLSAGKNEIVQMAKTHGYDDDATASMTAGYIGKSVAKIADTLIASGDPTRAKQVLDQYQDQMDAGSRLQVMTRLKPILLQQQATADANNKYLRPLLAPQAEGQPVPVSVDQIASAIHGQESGGNAAAATSVDGAVGGWQIRPATFQQYAKPGESITNPADNAAVGQRIVADLNTKFGGDPTRVAVGYFSGPGNVAPPGSTTPWLRDTVDGNGKSVSSYVSDVVSKLPAGSVRGAALMDKASVLAQVDRDYRDNPQLGNAVRTYVDQQFSIINTAAMAQAAQQKAAQEQAANGYVSSIIKGQTDGLGSKLADDPTLTSEQKKSISEMLDSHLRSGLGHDVQTYGPGFYQAYQAVHAADGDPNKLTDPSALYKMATPQLDVNGVMQPPQLTVAGVDKLTAEIQGKRSPEGEAETRMRAGALAYAKHQLSFDGDYGFMKDQKGEDAFNVGFTPAFYQAYDAGRAAGKTPAQLLSKDSPDFIVDKVAAPYLRTPAQRLADFKTAAAAMSADGVPGVPNGPDIGTPEGLKSAVLSGKMTRAAGIAEALKRGYIQPPAAPAVIPTVPMVQ